jgi:hypothetical protein
MNCQGAFSLGIIVAGALWLVSLCLGYLLGRYWLK